MKQKVIIIFGCILSVVSSCYYDKEDKLYPNSAKTNTTATCDTTDRKYSTYVQGVISTNCAISGCHVAGTTRVDLSNYPSLKANIAAVTDRAIVKKNMPPSGPLSNCDITKLKMWIDNGALQN
jgi:hypothetical protein